MSNVENPEFMTSTLVSDTKKSNFVSKTKNYIPEVNFRKINVLAKRNLSWRSISRQIHESHNWYHRSVADQKIEKLLFIPSDAHIPVSALNIESPNREHALDYKPVPVNVFKRAMSFLPDDLKKFEFIDLGAGRARAMLLASQYNFAKVNGVEFSAELVDDANMNIAQFPRPHMVCKKVEIEHKDILDYDLPEGPLVLFTYRSFDEVMYKKVLNHIKSSFSKTPRDLYFIAIDPPKNGSLSTMTFETGIFDQVSPKGNWKKKFAVEVFKTRLN